MLKKRSRIFRIICGLLAFLLFENSLERVQAQDTPFLPRLQNNILETSIPYSSPVLRGMRVYPDKPFEFDFMVDSGSRHKIDQTGTALLVKYFLTCLTVPEEDLWVNLSPYESGRVIPNELSLTDAGNTLLEQDKLLKQLASSMTYPESRLGKKFWEKVYKITYQKFGTTQLPVNTFNKVWIVPDKAIVYDMGTSALIGQTHLKVMLEEDYLALKHHSSGLNAKPIDGARMISAMITREIILPELEREINEGKNFAPVRQIFHSMVLAAWFKRTLRRNVLSVFYVNKKKISGVDGIDKNSKEKIYKQYLQIYKVGAYNYIREDVDPISQQVLPRKYFSGGLFFGDLDRAMKTLQVPDFKALVPLLDQAQMDGFSYGVAKVRLSPIGTQEDLGRLLRDAAGMEDQAQMSVPPFLRKLAGTIALAVSLSTPLSGLAQDNQYPIGQNSPAPATLVITAPVQAPVISTHILRYTGEILPEDRQDLQKIQKFVSSDDIIAMNGQKSPQTGRTYNVDVDWVARNRNRPYQREGRVIEALIVTAQHKLNAHEGLTLREDGRLGPETRRALAHALLETTQKDLQAGRVLAQTNLATPSPGGMLPSSQISQQNLPQASPQVTRQESTQNDLQAGGILAQTNLAAGSPGGSPPPPDDLLKLPALPVTASPLKVVQGAPGLSTTALTQQSTSQPGFANNKKIGAFSALLQPIPLHADVVSKADGFVTGLNLGKKEYKKGEIIFYVVDIQKIQKEIDQLTGALEVKRQTLKDVEAAYQQGAISRKALISARRSVLDLERRLAEARKNEKLGVVRAPHNLIVKDFKVSEGDPVSANKQVLEYYDEDNVRFDIALPGSVNYFENSVITLNGTKVDHVFWRNWKLSPDGKTYLSLIVTPASMTPLDQKVKFAATFYAPDKTPNMPNFQGQASTRTWVDKAREYNISAPGAGVTKYNVALGDKVVKGQVLAQVDPEPYKIQLESLQNEINGIDIKLTQATLPDGTLIISRDELDQLKAAKIDLKAQADALGVLIPRLNMTAPYDGTIVWSAQSSSDAVRENDGVFRILKSQDYLGNFDDTQYSILFSKSVKINAGDYVQVITLTGRLLGEVVAVDLNPQSSSVQLGQNQSVEIRLNDPQHLLRSGIQVQVILLTHKDKLSAIAALSASGKEQPSIASSSSAASEPLKGFVSQLFTQNTPGQYVEPAIPQAYYAPQGAPLTLSQVDQKVDQNRLGVVNEFYTFWQNKIAERYPRAKKFSLFGSFFSTGNGSTSFFGGAGGTLNGLTSVLTSGNLANYGLSVLGQFAGNLIDIIDGKIGKQEALARAVTKSSQYSLQAAFSQQDINADILFIELGVRQQNIARLTALKADLEEAQREALVLKTHNLMEDAQIRKIKGELLGIQEQIDENQDKEAQLTGQLNNLMGQKIDGLQQSVAVDVPWTGVYPRISDEQKSQWGIEKDPRWSKAQADLQVVKESQRLQGLKKLPSVTFGTNITAPDLPVGSLPFDPYSGTFFRTSAQQGGVNATVQAEFPLFDQNRNIQRDSLSSQEQEAQDKIEKTKRDLTLELNETINHINKLSQEIRTAEEDYQNSLEAWKTFAGYPEANRPYQYTAQRIELSNKLDTLLRLKSSYLMWEKHLQKMGILEKGHSLVTDKAMISDRAQAAHVSSFRRFVLGLVWAVTLAVIPLSAQEERQATPPIGYANSIMVNQNSGAFNDSNPINRMQALEAFKEYQGTQDITALERTMMSAPADVRQELFRFMVTGKDHDLRFFIQMIMMARSENRSDVEALAYQSLEDVLTQDPDILKTLNETNFLASGHSAYPDVTPQTTMMVILPWLATDTVDSMAKARFLLSDCYSSQDLAKIYNELNAYANGLADGPQKDKINNLAGLIYDVILRDKALENIDQVMSKASYGRLSTGMVFKKDIIISIRIQKILEENRRFLKTSSQWREMKKYIQGKLYVTAQKATQDLIARNSAGSAMSGFGMDNFSYPQNPTNSAFSYFDALDLGGQQKYIAASQNISELARMLEHSTYFRAIILDRLMASRDGRLLVLKVYKGSDDRRLLKLIEDRNWLGTIKPDIEAIADPAANHIVRAALAKMHERTKEEWPLNRLLDTYSTFELRSARDPRGDSLIDAEQKLVATKWAIDVLREREKYLLAVEAGEPTTGSAELNWLNNMALKLEHMNDPREVDAYLDAVAVNTGDSVAQKRWFDPAGFGQKDFILLRDTFVEGLRQNDQSIPPFLFLTTFFVWILKAVGVLALIGVIRSVLRKSLIKNAGTKSLTIDLQKRLVGLNGKAKHDNSMSAVAYAKGLVETLVDFPIWQASDSSKVPAIIPIPESLPNQVKEPLKNWRKLVLGWSQQDNLAPEDLLRDFNAILNNADELIRVMPYSPDLIWSDEEKPLNFVYNKSFYYFNLLADQTLDILSDRLQKFKPTGPSGQLSATQRLRFIQSTDAMLENMRYVSRYLRILKYRANIELVMGYKYPDSDWKELYGFGIYAQVRLYLGYQKLWKRSEARLKKDLPKLLDAGNALMPGLYKETVEKATLLEIESISSYPSSDLNPNNKNGVWEDVPGSAMEVRLKPNADIKEEDIKGKMTEEDFVKVWHILQQVSIVKTSEEKLEKVTRGGLVYSTQSVEDALNVKERRFFSRMWFMILPTEIAATLLFFFMGLAEIALPSLIVSGITATLAFLIYWPKHQQLLNMEWDKVMTRITDKLSIKLNNLYGRSGRNTNEDRDIFPEAKQREDEVRVRTLTKQEGQEQINIELTAAKPRVDAIVIIYDNKDQKNIANLRTYMENLRGRLIRQKIPVEVVPTKLVGSGNAYLDALLNFKVGHPELGPNALVMFVFHEKRSGSDYTRIDEAITKGYRAAASMTEPAGGNILIFDKDDYEGPIRQVPGADITLLTSRVTGADLLKLGWVHTDFTRDGKPRVLEILDRMDLHKLKQENQENPSGSRIVSHMEKEDLKDLSKHSLRQFSAFNGIALLGPNAVAKFEEISGKVKAEAVLRKKIPVSFIRDLVNPLIANDIADYVLKRSKVNDLGEDLDNGELQAVRADLGDFYHKYGAKNKKKPDLIVNAFVPSPRSEIYLPYFTRKENSSDAAAISSGTQKQGGIDLNFQPQFIQRPTNTEASYSKDAFIPAMPVGFQGFNFNIISFTPELTVNGAVQLMFNSK